MRNRVYISGPITGIKDYMARFRKAEINLFDDVRDGELDFTSIVNPAKVMYELPVDFEGEEYMTVCLAILSMCDSIYMLRGWEKSEGAKEEYRMAKAKGMAIYFEPERE